MTLQRLVDEWFDQYQRVNGKAPTWKEYVAKVEYFKVMLGIN